ncbi:MAG: YesL family protein [Chloroflexia bacterium]|nr:YesL family protein [Chloroflexia bacterium]
MVWDSVAIAGRLLWRRLGLLVLANVLWLLLSLPIVTWPAATAGLFTLARRVVAEELDDAPWNSRISDFWDGFRTHWRRSSLLTVIDLAGLGVIAVALVFYGRSAAEPIRWLAGPIALIGLVWLAAQLYVFPLLLERTANRPWEIMREALLMTLGYPLSSLSLLLTSLIIAVPAIVLAGPVLFVLFSAMAMVQTVALRQHLIQRGEFRKATP